MGFKSGTTLNINVRVSRRGQRTFFKKMQWCADGVLPTLFPTLCQLKIAKTHVRFIFDQTLLTSWKLRPVGSLNPVMFDYNVSCLGDFQAEIVKVRQRRRQNLSAEADRSCGILKGLPSTPKKLRGRQHLPFKRRGGHKVRVRVRGKDGSRIVLNKPKLIL